ncbi:MAG TPA: S9 family peptidase [Methylomirabilota bacterium]|nr:S9 family peptidase [Methylomirabilota bacterium]
MKRGVSFSHWIVATLLSFIMHSQAQVPDNLVVEGVPPIPQELRTQAAPYLESRVAGFAGWHPTRREMLITTRFAESAQLHYVRMPGGARKQITFFSEPVSGGTFRPKTGDYILFAQDVGGGEFYQYYRLDPASAKVELLTDGKSQNSGGNFSESGKWLAYGSTRRNGKDRDIWVIDPADKSTDRLVVQNEGGGWSVQDWTKDDKRLLLAEYISINESHLYLVDIGTGTKRPITNRSGQKVAYGEASFSPNEEAIYVTTDADSEFQQLTRIDLPSLKRTPLTANIRWDVTDFTISRDGKWIAFVTNEDGSSVLRIMDLASGKVAQTPELPPAVISGLSWHENNEDLGFTLTSARSPSDAYSYNVRSKKVERWTESETGGLDPQQFVQPELVRFKSFDDLTISAFVYKPDAKKFPGSRPSMILIHGGPESQSRPIFMGRYNFFLNELGISIVVPNVRGSSGYGKTFVAMDNGFKREDSVKDIGALISWMKKNQAFDPERIAVIGGSYGGYMVLASLVHYSDQLRAGIDIVGISNFLTFLKNTQDYRRDLRRAEYGDERDPAMHAHLEKISPLNNVEKIKRPLFVVQGKNDPRVPVTEAEQMVAALRKQGSPVWYLMAKDEGHGFAKKRNIDFQFYSTILFFQEHLLK